MKKISIITLLFALSFPVGSFAQGIVFETGTFAEALAKAEQEKKLVFVDFYTDWCGPCKKMTSDVFLKDNIGAMMNAGFVSIKIDAEKGEGPEIAKKYGVSAYPTMFVLNPDGTPVHRIMGAKDENAFIGEIQGMTKTAKYGGLLKMADDFNNGRNDEAFLKDFFTFLPAGNKNDKAKVAAKYLLNVSKARFMSDADDDITFVGGDNGMIENLTEWNDEVMGRMLDMLVEKITPADGSGQLGKFSDNYSIGIVFGVETKTGRFMQQAIDTSDEEMLEKTIKFQQNFRSRLQRRVDGDGDVNIFNGRGIFFASPEFIRLYFMSSNRVHPERFKAEIVSYMEKIMADNPVNAINNGMPKDVSEEKSKGRADIGIFNATWRNGLSMDAFTLFANYYWRIMPNDKKTKDTVAKWLNYTTAINPYNVKAVTGAIPLLLKVGYRQDAVNALQNVIDSFGQFDIDMSKHTSERIADMIQDIKNDKI